MNHRHERELDRFLDRALREYSEDSPRTGLEQRTLASMASHQVSGRHWWWVWTAVPVCAVLLVAVLWWRSEGVEVPPQANLTMPGAPQLVRPSAPRSVVAKRHIAPGHDQQAAENAPPRLPAFPSQPEQSQARMLLRFVQGSPQAAQRVVKQEEDYRKLIAQGFSGPQESVHETETR